MPCRILVEDFEVVPCLTQMRLPKEILLDIFERGLGERSNVNENDPVTTYGTETWRWMTRFLREHPELRASGWVKCRHNQMEGIRNDALKIKLVVMNTDSATGIPSKLPRNVAGKGPSCLKHIKSNSEQIPFAFFESDVDHPIDKYDFFVFCAYAGEKYASAEISRPDGLRGETISSFSTRVMLCQPGEFTGYRRPVPVPEDFAEIEKPVVVRKR